VVVRDRARGVSLVVAGLAALGALAAAAAPSTTGMGPARSAVEAPVSALGAVRPVGASRAGGVETVIAHYRNRIPQLMRNQHVPGLAVAVVDRDRVLWQEGFGSTDTDGRTPVTADTAFSVQSMSKVFTATAVLEAVQAGRVGLDTPITTYLPGFTVRSAFEQHPERRITLRMLLSCTAGFTHEAPSGSPWWRTTWCWSRWQWTTARSTESPSTPWPTVPWATREGWRRHAWTAR
jgi:CubicO group peptidase (beta-lactamase class C family)